MGGNPSKQREDQKPPSKNDTNYYNGHHYDEEESDENDERNVCGFAPNLICWCGSNKRKKKFELFGTPMMNSVPVREKSRDPIYGGLEVERSEHNLGTDSRGQPSVIVHDGVNGEIELHEKYEICEVLGVGSTSTCNRCVERRTGQSFACKIIDKRHIQQRFNGMIDQFHTEIEALRSLNHPNIITLFDVYITNEKIYIVMELLEGGELFDYVVQKGTLNEEEASKIVRMVTSALVYMHEENIVHRDLKPENLLLVRSPTCSEDIDVKIIDFGLSKCMAEPVATSFLGTRGYLAPEMLQRREYSKPVDTWALGVIVFVLLCGCLPFDDGSDVLASDDMVRARFVLRFPRWAKNLSPSAKDLLARLLDIRPEQRLSAEEALEHPWVRGKTASRKSLLQSPSRIQSTPGGTHLTPGGSRMPKGRKGQHQRMNHRINARDRHRYQAPRQLVRKTSI